MLDRIVNVYYLRSRGEDALIGRLQFKHQAAQTAMVVLQAFREDLLNHLDVITELGTTMGGRGYPLSPMRILELLVWAGTEPNSYYRDRPAPDQGSPDRSTPDLLRRGEKG